MATSHDASAATESTAGTSRAIHDETTTARRNDDPRSNARYVRRIRGADDAGITTLVGVVHDHPASVHRVRSLVDDEDPAILALELPPVALSLFRSYAQDTRTPPSFGGEMSAAIQACDGETVAIDGPSRPFVRSLYETVGETSPSLGTVRNLCASVLSVSRHAAICAIAAVVARRTALRVEVDSPVAHDCDPTDSAAVQAADEEQAVTRSTSLLRTIETPPAAAIRRTAREKCMARNLAALRRTGDVLAVVGIDHLDGITSRLTA